MAEREAAILARLISVMTDLSGFAENDIDAGRTFLELGFDSLFLTQLATAFQKEFGTPVTFRQLITDHPTPAALAAWVSDQAPAPEPTVPTDQPAREAEPQIAAPTFAKTNRDTDEIANVFARQLELMRNQLEFLRANGSAAVPAAAEPAESTGLNEALATPSDAASASDDAPATLPAGFGPQTGEHNGDLELTTTQRRHVERLVARYNAKTPKSKEHVQADRARHADPRTAAGFNPLWKEMVYPIVVNRSKGAYLWDVDDNQYIDLLNGFGPNFFGHRADFVTEALKAQLDDGFEIGPQTPHAGDAAALLCELTGMERASWVNTGSEAVQAAIRIARTVSGCDKIVVFKGSYHGNFDEVLVRGVSGRDGAGRTLPLAPGIPFGSVENVIVLEYGKDEALEAIAADAASVAAVLVEPVQSRRPDFQPREFLQKLRRLTEEKDIALVFDEVITGFRTGPGGAQEYFGVRADLATYGKILGGGMPIGAVAGSSKYMDTFDGGQWRFGDASKPEAGVTFFAGTFVRHPLAIAAAYASLRHLKEQGPALQERASALAARFADELNAFFEERGVRFRVLQFASQMFFRIDEPSPLATLFFYHMRERGVHLLEGFPCYMTAAHTGDDVAAAIDAARETILEMQADGVLPDADMEDERAQPVTARMPLTAGQELIWSIAQFGAQASCAFNESDRFQIDGALDRDAFADAVNTAIAAHEAFRLRFDAVGAVQFVADGTGFALKHADLSDLAENEQQRTIISWVETQATTPFDLEEGPLCRARLFRIDDETHVFVFFAHHLVFDGYSSDLLIRDISRRYGAGVTGECVAPSETAPYSAYVSKTAALTPVPQFWRQLFADGAPPPLDLPTDAPRAEAFSFRGATARRTVPAEASDEIRAMARRLGVSMSAVTMSAYAALLSGLSGRADFVIGLPAAGQARHGVETVGYCVNVLPMPVRAAAEQTFERLAKNLQELTFDAFEHQDLSLTALTSELAAASAPGNRPLIEAMFNFGGYFRDLKAAGVTFRAAENERRAVCNELFFNMSDAGDALHIDLEYAADLFDAATIEAWLDDYVAILSEAARDSAVALSELTPRRGGSRANVVLFESHRVKREGESGAADGEQSLSATEHALVEAVGAVLGREDVSVDAGFFELGGHSIHASRLLTRLRLGIAPTLGIRAIFESESLRSLAAHIDELNRSDEIIEREEFVF